MRVTLIVALLLAGCAGNPALSSDQIKNANVLCADAATMGGSGQVLAITLDQNVIRAGGMTVKCGEKTTTITIVKP